MTDADEQAMKAAIDANDPIKALDIALRAAGARPTFDHLRSTRLPCVICGETKLPRDLVTIGVYTRRMAGNLRDGDRIDRPMCADCRELTEPFTHVWRDREPGHPQFCSRCSAHMVNGVWPSCRGVSRPGEDPSPSPAQDGHSFTIKAERPCEIRISVERRPNGEIRVHAEENVWDVGWTDSKEDADARVRKMNALSEHHHALEEVALANFHKEHTAVGELLAETPEGRRAAVSAYYRSEPFMAAARERWEAEKTRTAEAQKAIGDPRWRHSHWPSVAYHVVAIGSLT